MQEPLTVDELKQQQLETMRKAAAQSEAYQRLLQHWTKDEVRKYLEHVANEDAPAYLDTINARTIAGLATDFHERFEMTLIEHIVDERLGSPGTYRKALQEGNIKQYDYFDTGEFTQVNENIRRKKIFRPYFEAHPQAMRAEMEFLKSVASELGIEVSPLALFVARPVLWDDFLETGRTLQDVYTLHRQANLRIPDEQEDAVFPRELPENFAAELQTAQDFYLEYGSHYVELPTHVLEKNGLK